MTTDPTPYTPTDEDMLERIRSAIAEADASTIDWERRLPDDGYGPHATAVLDALAPFLAARDARVRAEAVRAAAQAFNVEAVYFSSHDRSISQGQQAAVVDVLAESLNWLHARAASIEQETQP